ncbi:NAD(P)/FAD-dependent oxidoreductase [Salinimicrobium sediminilitoris]|uniref:NAD(P)/FAD-dependent oxidoreductase n=1 Tax=Salinimicrobium sediminilitoris TaxID=2876715 RepID=UPI001E5CC08D|nr:FAD-binding protein [Salinimicrobium sediminilitoris]MCC8359342.1 FAD-binding protein [Salinimicrobium sediminilitoris]
MQQEFSFQVSPETAGNPEAVKHFVSRQYGLPIYEITHVEILKRSIDARQRNIKVNLKVQVYLQEDFEEKKITTPEYKNVSNAEEIIIVGAGPAGLFAALRCIELGKKPIVLERGKDVRARRRDLKKLNIEHVVNEDSNYCFGEGGAGTYSDGKLYTRSKKRGDVNRILELLVAFGATNQILVEAHPHIGTNKLPAIIQDITKTIIDHGGEVLFNSRVTDILLQSEEIEGVVLMDGRKIVAKKLILATGHSARDIFTLLYNKKIFIEAKPFALGVRVEHPQALIDQIQYHTAKRGEFLPPSSYSIVKQVKGRGVYSFCMCPGGIIAPCATSPGEIVTNGWSPSKRDQATANSGIVVEIKPSDFAIFGDSPLAALKFQQEVEKKAWIAGGKTQTAPAQRLVDFSSGRISSSLPETSYKPGIASVELGEVLPGFVYESLQKGFIEFGKSMKGYFTNEAVVHATESRTSSPVRIPRDRETLEHFQIKGLYPCGEGAGYAGGIVSAAIDGEKCAEKAVLAMG